MSVDSDPNAPVELEISDTLDLHSFPPHEIADVVRSYIEAAAQKGIRFLRIIHGRGMGVQRRTVRTVLERDPKVIAISEAPSTAGGWGATCVTLRSEPPDER